MNETKALLLQIKGDISDLKAKLGQAKNEIRGLQSTAMGAGSAAALAFADIGKVLAVAAAAAAPALLAMRQGLKVLDEYKLTTIGVAATLTDLAKDQTKGQQNYNAFLAYSKDMYEKLELAAAKYFASGQDLTQAWNILAQKGVVLREQEIEHLGVIVDKIKLATAGQVQGIQIAQELRAVFSGQARATDQIAMLLKDKLGPAWEEIVKKVRETGSLKPLAEQFEGLKYASADVQNTLESQWSTLKTMTAQVGRAGLAGAYEDVVGLLKKINQYLADHKDEIAGAIKGAWNDLKVIAREVALAVERIYGALKAIAGLMPDLVGMAKAWARAMAIDRANWDMMSAFMRGDLKAAQEAAARRFQEEYGTLPQNRAIRVTQTPMGLQVVGPKPEIPPIEMPKTQKPGGEPPGGGGKGAAKQQAEDLLRIWGEYYEARRKLAIDAAQSEFEVLKARFDKEKVELAVALEQGQISAEEYYRRLNELGQKEADAALAVIKKKIEAEKEAYAWAVKEINAREMSPEARELMLGKLAFEHRANLLRLEAEAAKVRLDREKEFVEVIKEGLEARKKSGEILLDMEGKAAFTELEKHEAEINRLLYEQAERRRELLRLLGLQVQAGLMTPAAAAAQVGQFDVLAGRELNIKKIGEEVKSMAQALASGISNLIDSLLEGGKNLRESINRFFKDLFKKSLEPGFKALTAYLEQALMKLFTDLGKGAANAILGAIALIGMALTSGGGSSWSPSGATAGVTSHEAVRGIIAGETSIPIAKIGESLKDALVDTNLILKQIEQNTRTTTNAGGGADSSGAASDNKTLAELKQTNRYLQKISSIDVNPGAVVAAINAILEEYFAAKLQTT